ncbi:MULTISPECIES: reverse transcriptase domain-containing protein, partial [unclassified Frankia]
MALLWGQPGDREELDGQDEAIRETVRNLEVGGVGSLEAGEGEPGAAGVDGCTVADFETDLKNNLYKVWNRMSSGSYFPPPVMAVEIPKSHGEGTRVLGVPTVADRVAQTVVARRLGAKVEPIFHPDSYGYRPGRSALDAVAACRDRCWRYAWVIDLDVQAFFDSVDHDLLLRAVERHADAPWVMLYVRRWLVAPLVLPDGSVQARSRGTPQGNTANLSGSDDVDIWRVRVCHAGVRP